MNCHGLKMMAADGKMRMTDVADTEKQIGTVVIQHKIVFLAPQWQTKHS
jgi:hypothetical protein